MTRPAALLLLLTTTVYSATIADLISTNSALTSQADTYDIAVVALTAQSPPTTAQQVPPSFQSLTSSISSALTSLTPTAPTSDPPTEFSVVESWGHLANTIEELMEDYVGQRNLLITTFGLEAAMHTQLVSFNATFVNYANFIHGLVGDATHQASITMITSNTIGRSKTSGLTPFGILEAFDYYT